jgi:RNA polymerase sigma-70 factor (ECF subfamily)
MNPDAFHTLAMTELDAVYRFACHLARRREEAEDLVQETYLRALKSCGSFVPAEHGIRPWLFKILHNLVNTRLAKGARDRKLLAAYGAEQDLETAQPDGRAETDEAVNWDNVDQRLKAAVLELPLAYRVVFLLSAVEGLKYREIADLTEVPIGTVMSRLSRARQNLADRLGDLAAENNLRSRSGNPPGGNKPGGGRSSPGDQDDSGKEASSAT